MSWCAESLWYLVVLGLSVLRALNLGLLCILGLEGILLLLCTLCLGVYGALLKLFLVFTIPVFFHIFANRPVQSPSTSFCFGGGAALGVGCSCAWGSIFMVGLEFVAVTVLLARGIGQSFLNSKRFPDIVPALGHGVLVQTGMFLVVEDCFLEYILLKASGPLSLLGP